MTPENVHAFANMQILVRTTEAYRRALGAVADPAMNCVGIVVKVKADQVDKHGEGLRVDVLWDNARPLEGYRVGYQRAFDLEAAVPPETGVNPFLASPADSQTLHAQKRSLWSRMKLPFKSPFSSKTQASIALSVLQFRVPHIVSCLRSRTATQQWLLSVCVCWSAAALLIATLRSLA